MSPLIVRTVPAAAEILAERERNMRQVEVTCKSQVQWWETETVAEYRRRRLEGDGFPKPTLYQDARTVSIQGRDGKPIELRVIQACTKPQGIILHFHAGTSDTSLSLQPLSLSYRAETCNH